METFKEPTIKTFGELTDEELDLTAEAALDKANLSEEELQAVLGHLDSEQSKESEEMESKATGIIGQDFKTLLAQSESYFQMGKTLPKGLLGGFWKKFNNKAQHIICKNQEVMDYMNNNGTITLKGTLKYVVPLIVSALGLAAIYPWALGILIGILAMIVKTGFKTYCQL